VKAAIDAHEHAEAAAEARKIEEGRRLGRARAVDEAARREEDAVRLKLAAGGSDPAAARWAELRAKARSPDAQKFLQPFLEPGFGQPRTDLSGKLHFDLGAEKKPMSLAALKAAGVFTPGDKGLVAFATLAAHPENDRPRWKVDANPDGWSKGTRDSVTHGRGLLVELADALVDEKLLRP
jgi:TPR repeat protein